MTHHTDAELPRDIEEHMRNMWEARLLPAACWPTELAQRLTKAARRAPAAPVPQGWKPVPVELLERIQESLGSFVSDQGWSQSDMDTADALDGLLAAAPRPPEAGCSVSNGETQAAPVQLPEPQAEIEVRSMKTYLDLSIHEWRNTLPDGAYNIFTEHQVRQLLANHGIQERST